MVEAELAQIPDVAVPLPAPLEGNMLRFTCDQPFEEANRLRYRSSLNEKTPFLRFSVLKPLPPSLPLPPTPGRVL